MKRSKVSRLAPELRRTLEQRWGDGIQPLSELRAWLEGQLREAPDAMPSRASLGRYLKNYERKARQSADPAWLLANLCLVALEKIASDPGLRSRLAALISSQWDQTK